MRFAGGFRSVCGEGMNWELLLLFRLANTLFQGDIQMCAMAALVAQRELRISRRRVTRFLDSYIGVLERSLFQT